MTTNVITAPFTVTASTTDNFDVFGAGVLTVSAGATVSGVITAGDSTVGPNVLIDGTTLQSILTSGGLQVDRSGGTADHTAVFPGGEELVFGGTSLNTVVGTGGLQAVFVTSAFGADILPAGSNLLAMALLLTL
jgi:hypothetical protein